MKDRETDRQTDRQRDRETERERERGTDTHTHTHRLTDTHTHTHTHTPPPQRQRSEGRGGVTKTPPSPCHEPPPSSHSPLLDSNKKEMGFGLGFRENALPRTSRNMFSSTEYVL